jgi:FkbM family methyltransferase
VDAKGEMFETDLTTHGALSRCLARGTKVNSLIDVGASDGRWSLDCIKFFPNAQYLMIEAQVEHEIALKKVIKDHPNFNYVIAAAGSKQGKIYFNNDDLFGGTAYNEPIEGGIEVQMTSIDAEVKQRNLQPPYLIKLDTHGFELPILEGAIDTMKQASLIIIEAYNYQLLKDSLKYYEMCKYMEERGFSTIEMADLMLRKHDASFWQMDLFFIPSNSKEFNYNSYK